MHEVRDPVTTPWDDWLIHSAHAYRRAMHAHPGLAAWAVSHFATQVPTPTVLEVVVGKVSQDGRSVLTGYAVLSAGSLSEACEKAKDCPALIHGAALRCTRRRLLFDGEIRVRRCSCVPWLIRIRKLPDARGSADTTTSLGVRIPEGDDHFCDRVK
jgi:hypothetical protein